MCLTANLAFEVPYTRICTSEVSFKLMLRPVNWGSHFFIFTQGVITLHNVLICCGTKLTSLDIVIFVPFI